MRLWKHNPIVLHRERRNGAFGVAIVDEDAPVAFGAMPVVLSLPCPCVGVRCAKAPWGSYFAAHVRVYGVREAGARN